MQQLPILGITMGDICGIGPEIAVKAMMKPETYQICRPIIVGDSRVVERGVKAVSAVDPKAKELKVHSVTKVSDALFQCGTLDVYEVPLNCEDVMAVPYGKVTALGGEAAFTCVRKVIELAMANEIDGTITGPLNKEAMNLAGYHYSGHTEIYAEFTGTKDYAMMLADEKLRVVHVSTHVSLREACDRVKKARVLECIRIANEGCKAIGIKEPKIGVAGLNPHCGENGMFGTEEIEEIQPAIDAALAEGINIPEKKPTPPDTVFSKALGGWYDIVVVMYHDQGHIPLKVKGFVYNKEEKHWEAVAGVNVTLGLPIIRASVDHGTGFGHAGSGHANELSLVNAMDYGIRLAENRKA